MKLKFCFILLISICSFNLNAQTDYLSKNSLGIGVGTSSYLGDLGKGTFVKDVMNANFSVQARFSHRHSKIFTTDVNLMYGRLKGDDAKTNSEGRRARNLSFKSRYIELGIFEEIYPLNFFLSEGTLPFEPYFITGFSVFHFKPTSVASDGNTYSLRDLGTEGQGAPGYAKKYSLYNFALPIGLGLKMKLSNRLSVKLDGIMKYTNTDYIDDVSTNYAPYDVLLQNGGPIAVELSDRRANPTYTGQRGFSNRYDTVFNMFATFSYRLSDNSAVDCYQF